MTPAILVCHLSFILPNREVFQNRAADEFALDGIFGNKFLLKRQEPFQESQQAFRVSFSPRKRQGNRILLPKQLHTWEWCAYWGAGLYNGAGYETAHDWNYGNGDKVWNVNSYAYHPQQGGWF